MKRIPRWQLDGQQARRIAAILATEPGLTLQTLADRLEALGEQPPHNKARWTPHEVQRMLHRAGTSSPPPQPRPASTES